MELGHAPMAEPVRERLATVSQVTVECFVKVSLDYIHQSLLNSQDVAIKGLFMAKEKLYMLLTVVFS